MLKHHQSRDSPSKNSENGAIEERAHVQPVGFEMSNGILKLSLPQAGSQSLLAHISLGLALSCGAGFPACHPRLAFKNGRLESLPHMRKHNPYAR